MQLDLILLRFLNEKVIESWKQILTPPPLPAKKNSIFDIEISSWFLGRRIFRKYGDVSCLPRKRKRIAQI
jgi:hypothetical protein